MNDVEAFTQHMRTLEKKHGAFVIEASFGTIAALIAQVQLALRHPGNRGESARLVRELIEDIIVELDEASPGMGALMRRGFSPEYDLPRTRH